MKKIIFARILKSKNDINWDWSGTVTSLYKELQERFCVIELFFCWNAEIKVRKILEKLHILKYDMSLREIFLANRKYSRFLQKNNTLPILQFDEFPFENVSNSCIYQDLSAIYLYDIAHTNTDLFKYSGFSHIPISKIYIRSENQRLFYKSCKYIFTMSNWLKEYLTNKKICDESKIIHVGGGINLDPSKIDKKLKKGNKILFVGKDFKRKGGYLVVESFNYLNKYINNSAELYIIGPKKINLQLVNPNIHFIGELNSDELSYYFNLCDIFCMPSYFEAYGLVFIEALCYGLPCIGRNIHEMPYFIDNGKTGYLIEDDNVEQLAILMNKALLNQDMKNNVEKNREFYISEYSWKSVINRISKYL